MRTLCLCAVLALGFVLMGCADREIEFKPRGQMVVGGSVSGSTSK